MALYLTEADVQTLVGINDAIAALDAAFAQWGDGSTHNLPRQRLPLAVRSANLMAASLPSQGVLGHKAYFGGCQYFTLFSIAEKKMLALIEAGTLGALRTGAATAVAARRLARADAATVALVGAGRQGRTQLMAVCGVLPVRTARVFSRTPETRERFAAEMAETLSIEIVAAADAESCVRGADVAIAMTNAAEPVILGDWLAPGMFVAAAGANARARRELDDCAVRRASRIVTDDRAQARSEACELIDLADAGALAWEDVVELGDIVAGRAPGRQAADEITLYKSLGIALEDVAFGKVIYDRAVEAGVGTPFGTP